MAFSESWLNELIARNDIVSVVSSYVELKPKGRRLWGLCPMHGEKTASFSVSPDKQLFYCFGCHAGGTVIQFVMDVERLPFGDAVRFLAERAGMQMPDEVDDAEMQRARAYRERLYEACKLSARFFMETLLGALGGEGRAYLKQRGITSDSVKRFGIGFAPNEWNALKTYLFDKGFTQQELLDAGLLVFNQSKNSVYDAYRNRVIFPIVGTGGRVLGFGARVLDNTKPKYINTGDTPIYNKRNNLYGLNLQKGGKPTDLVMVEGYTDVIGLYEQGVTNVVASLGTALTVQQARLIKRYVETVYIAYDGDAAGQAATIRGLDILSNEGLSVRVIVFPDALDPDEFIRTHGREAFDRLKDEALTLNAFKLESMARAYALDRENERERFAMEACRFIAGLQPIEQERYYRQLAKRTGYPVEALQAQGGSAGTAKQALHRTNAPWKHYENTGTKAETERMRAETALLAAMLTDKSAAEQAVKDGAEALLQSKAHRTMFAAIREAYANGQQPNAAAIIAGMERADAAAAGAVLKDDTPLSDPTRTVQDCLRRMRRYDLNERIQELSQSLGEPGLDTEERMRRLDQIQKWNREMRGI